LAPSKLAAPPIWDDAAFPFLHGFEWFQEAQPSR